MYVHLHQSMQSCTIFLDVSSGRLGGATLADMLQQLKRRQKTAITSPSSESDVLPSFHESNPCLTGHLSVFLLKMRASHLYDVLWVYRLQLAQTGEVKDLSLHKNVHAEQEGECEPSPLAGWTATDAAHTHSTHLEFHPRRKKTNLQKELWRLKANAASIGSKTTPTPSSSTVSSALAAPLALSPRVLPREDSYDTVLVVCWDECCPVTADSKAAKQRNERIKRNKGKIRLPQPSPIKQPAAPAEGSPLPPSILDLVSRFSLWTLITRLPPTSLVASQTSLPPTQTSSPKKRRVRDTKD
ncbi:hypothetical protein BLNAU_9519 [Blattamonas nauphoetae]|uniref:Uncharacterized protein n=1 Tax=Blattamonas nauphoetae TaxID=2049346 RepID=A0ABQ9XVF6_9EUKA|nr:hypothetical protein BLNAU_9519 [Blattamonas nauphoetae]